MIKVISLLVIFIIYHLFIYPFIYHLSSDTSKSKSNIYVRLYFNIFNIYVTNSFIICT